MKEGKFTKGEWTQSHRRKDNGFYSTEVYTKENPSEVICTIQWYPNREVKGITSTYREPNAKLIAAAPLLLEALQELIDPLTGLTLDSINHHMGADVSDKIEQAINKAV